VEYQSDNTMQRLKDTIVNQYVTAKFYFIVLAFIVCISVLTIYSAILVSEYKEKKDDEQTESITILINSTKLWNDYQAHKLKEKLYQMQIDNLNIALSDKNQQQSQYMYKQQSLEKYQQLIDKLHASKDHKDSLKYLRYKAETQYNNTYDESLREIEKNKKLGEHGDFVIILLIIGASLGGMSVIAKYKPLGYSAFSFGGLGVVILLLTMFLPQVTMFLPQVTMFLPQVLLF
jgi:hypothetical protein